VGFEPTIPVFERAKTVEASDGAATVIGPSPTLLTAACDMSQPSHTGTSNKISKPDLQVIHHLIKNQTGNFYSKLYRELGRVS
jgi:hypothetical protein